MRVHVYVLRACAACVCVCACVRATPSLLSMLVCISFVDHVVGLVLAEVAHTQAVGDDVSTLHFLKIMYRSCIELAGCLPVRYYCELYMVGSP